VFRCFHNHVWLTIFFFTVSSNCGLVHDIHDQSSTPEPASLFW
jgi:hypothetical protein